MFIAFLCATAAVAGAANIAIVDDVLEFDTPIGGAVVKGALHVGGEITAGTEKVKVIATLAKCTADSENNAEAIQVQQHVAVVAFPALAASTIYRCVAVSYGRTLLMLHFPLPQKKHPLKM